MMGIVVPETCWAYKKYNKIISGIYLVFILQLFNVSASYVSEFFFLPYLWLRKRMLCFHLTYLDLVLFRTVVIYIS